MLAVIYIFALSNLSSCEMIDHCSSVKLLSDLMACDSGALY